MRERRGKRNKNDTTDLAYVHYTRADLFCRGSRATEMTGGRVGAQSVNKHNCWRAQAHRANTYTYTYILYIIIYGYSCSRGLYSAAARVMPTGAEKTAAVFNREFNVQLTFSVRISLLLLLL